MNIARWGRLHAIAAEAAPTVLNRNAIATFFRSGLERNLFLDHLPLTIHDLVQIQVVTTLVFRRAE